MRRREFIAGLGAAAGWPLTVRAQQAGRVRRVAILHIGSQSERVTRTQQDALQEGLAKQGWIEGRSVRFDVRYAEDDFDRIRVHADELVGLAPSRAVSPVGEQCGRFTPESGRDLISDGREVALGPSAALCGGSRTFSGAASMLSCAKLLCGRVIWLTPARNV